MRKIIHVDMDAFFASVEVRDNPRLRGVPLIIGGNPAARGVVATASYEARKFGVHSAMPSRRAYELCPHGVFMPPNIAKYVEESKAIFDIYRRYSSLVEPVSIDEAYIDVTENYLNNPSATLIAAAIREAIFRERKLTASAGVSYNKFLAKMASEKRKPDGLSVIIPAAAADFLENLPIEKFHGVGKVTAGKFQNMGVRCGRDLLKLDVSILIANFGKVGAYYYNIVRGIDERSVEPTSERKSVGREITFQEDTENTEIIEKVIAQLSGKVALLLAGYSLAGRTITLKLRYNDFQTITRASSFMKRVNDSGEITSAALAMLKKIDLANRKVRLLGVTVSNFTADDFQNRPLPPIQLEFNFDNVNSIF